MNANTAVAGDLWRIAAAGLGVMLALPAAAQQDDIQGTNMSMQMPAPRLGKPKAHQKLLAAPTPVSSAQDMDMQHMEMSPKHGPHTRSHEQEKPSMPGIPKPMQLSIPVEVQHLHFGNMVGTRPKPGGLAERSQRIEMSSMRNMSMSSIQGGKAPPDARSADYSDGYRYTNVSGMEMADRAKVGMLLIDQLEYAHDNHGDNATFLDAEAWYGEDFNEVWLKTEGEATRGRLRDLRTEALWNHAISTYWGTQLGMRQDLGDGPGRTWAAFGIQGLAPYWFETEAELYLGADGRTAARVQLQYEELIIQRLILQPKVEVNLYGKGDPQRGIGSGLSDTELGVRLRYEIKREFGPYIGLGWRERYGRTATLARAKSEHASELQFAAGVHFWF